jgi:hypothetical protein
MEKFNLYHRLTQNGTLSEPQGLPDSDFSLPSTVYWMHALALLTREIPLNFSTATTFYQKVQKRAAPQHEINTIFEQLLFAVHQLSALSALRNIPRKGDMARVGIVAWYYGIYAAASAMVTAKDGTFQEDHSGTANQWDKQLSACRLIMSPFNYRLSTLVESDYRKEMSAIGIANSIYLQRPAVTATDALGACYSYLAGSGDFYRLRTCDEVRGSKDFKALDVANFRKKAARVIRDNALRKKSVCFVHQAFRYRGKANYRDAIFLGYGQRVESLLLGYDQNLYDVFSAFLAMAGGYISRRIGGSLWKAFTTDLEQNRSFSMSLYSIWR